MASLFDNIKTSGSLITDSSALDLDYLPKLLIFRESEQIYIADCIKPLFNNISGKNLLITGSPGIGKSAAVRFVLRELEEQGLDEEIFSLYINCWKNNTEHKLLLEICSLLKYRFTSNKTSSELLTVISKIINKKSAVICLDEVDKLEDYSILYSLVEEIYKKTIILVTNNTNFLAALDKRIYSRLTPEIINFKKYSYEETKKILNQRISLAFQKDSIEQEAFEEIAVKSSFEKDIRIGLTLLKESANLAELKNSFKIKKEHALEAIQKLFPLPTAGLEQFIVSLLKENKELSTKEILEKLNNPDISYRQITRLISKLKNKNLISTKILTKGAKGNIPVYFLKQTTL